MKLCAMFAKLHTDPKSEGSFTMLSEALGKSTKEHHKDI